MIMKFMKASSVYRQGVIEEFGGNNARSNQICPCFSNYKNMMFVELYVGTYLFSVHVL